MRFYHGSRSKARRLAPAGGARPEPGPQRASDVRSAALLVCTYRRPTTFAKFIDTVAALERPAGLGFSLVVADNNPECAWESYVGPAVARLAIPVHYGHEPRAGYSNARNTAIELALANTDAEVLLFSDDDMLLSPTWLNGHLASLAELGCDVVNGRIHGVRQRFSHGARLKKCGAGNVSFRRRLVDRSGLGLRFDPALNELGTEDQAFFTAATARGVVIRQSDLPLLFNYYGEDAVPEEEIVNKMLVTASMHQNQVARIRNERGLLPALAQSALGLAYGAKGALQALAAGAQRLVRSDAARKTALSARKEFLKMRGRFRGLSGATVSRREIRRSDPGAHGSA